MGDLLLYLAIPLVVYPLVIRFVLTPLIFWRLSSRHLPEELEYIRDGWSEPKEAEAVDRIIDFVKARLRPTQPFRPRPLDDAKELMLLVGRIYYPDAGPDGELRLNFSIRRLLESGLFAYGDLVKKYGAKGWFRLLSSLPLKWFYRYGTVDRWRRRFYNLAPVRKAASLRLVGPLFRLLLLPFLGAPVLILTIIRSFLLIGLLEGFSRFYYSELLIRFGYYLLHLYCDKESLIAERSGRVNRKQVFAWGKMAESLLQENDPEMQADTRYLTALRRYRQLLAAWKIDPDRVTLRREASALDRHDSIDSFGEFLLRIARRLFHSGRQVLVRIVDSGAPAIEDVQRMKELAEAVGSAFYPGHGRPELNLRPGDLIESGYLALLLTFYRLYQIPGLPQTLGGISLNVVITAKGLIEDDSLRFAAKGFQSGWRAWRASRRVRRLGRVIRTGSGITGFAVTLAVPIAGQGVVDMARSFAYHRVGRLLLHLYGRSLLPRKGFDSRFFEAFLPGGSDDA
ncbi:hypothetical protein [Sediminispirochaeta smaragdinae]|uniref:Uncharacterized protein n=1 Tax=Sediminispirochaeta smaragdinae (strain DSM 11293 / JCM 15392 / SEBR 4228) TaxID=573413 RepID=E1R954_SEDSS|nr:hypothetical protein [Sediminispirochaeta smaragdinae]ADK83023.1 hypothetical protein Spirs_3938 [Sediminispirochaeta smaragdinae DSM 11293]